MVARWDSVIFSRIAATETTSFYQNKVNVEFVSSHFPSPTGWVVGLSQVRRILDKLNGTPFQNLILSVRNNGLSVPNIGKNIGLKPRFIDVGIPILGLKPEAIHLVAILLTTRYNRAVAGFIDQLLGVKI